MLAALLGAAVPAAAHSLLLEATPAPGAAVRAPARLSLRFNNRIEKALSRARVVDERGAAVALVSPEAGGDADRFVGALPALPPGRYRVEWQVLSTDGHIVTGAYTFRVAP